MSTLVITRGIPASGKTTWARKWVAEDPANRMRVNRDDVRAMVHTDYTGGDTEQATTLICHAAVRQALRKGKDVVCDDTNLNARFLKALLKMAEGAGADVQFKDFNIPVLNAVFRDASREAFVGRDVIEKMAKRYLVNGLIPEPPTATPPVAYEPYVPDTTKPKAIIIDIDGTVAINDGHRSFYDYTKVYDDKVNWPIVELVHEAYGVGVELLFVSGRKNSCREQTVDWLTDKAHIEADALYMRKDGDDRDDAIVKYEIFNEHIRKGHNVLYVLDDRNRVVEMWRKLGLTVLQVADGDF